MVIILGIGPLENATEYENHWKLAIADARAWWEKIQAKGERHALIEMVSSGDDDPVSLAKWMIKKYPADSFDAITSAIRQNKDEPDLQADLVSLLPQTKSPKTARFVSQLMVNAEYGQTIAASAMVLASTEPDLALTRLISEWKKASTKTGNNYYSIDIEALLKTLMAMDRSEAVDALSASLTSERVDLRQAILKAVDDSVRAVRKPNASDKVYRNSIERLLVKELSDLKTAQFTGVQTPPQDLSLRLCDMAALSLSTLEPLEYRFDKSASIKSRNDQLKQCLDTWNRKHQGA